MAHDRPLLPDALDLAHRPEPSPERLRLRLRDRLYTPRFEFLGAQIVLVVFDVAHEGDLDAQARLAALMARE